MPDEDLAEILEKAERHFAQALRRGSAAELVQAITRYRQVLDAVPPLTGAPRGSALNNLASCYLTRGSDKDVDRAISLYRQALEVPERAETPLHWAMTQYSLSAALVRSPRPSPERVEGAVQAAEAALEVLTREEAEVHWASACTNLGIALVLRYFLSSRDRQDVTDLLRAVEALEAAISAAPRTGGVAPDAYAQLSVAYSYLAGRSDSGRRRDEYLRQFAKHAVTVRSTRPRDVELHRLMDRALVRGYCESGKRDPGAHTEEFIRRCEQYLAGNPRDGAELRHELGDAYLRRIDGDRHANATRATAEYEAALVTATTQADRTRIHTALGDAHRAAGDSTAAVTSYRNALRAAANLASDTVSASAAAVEIRTVTAAAQLLVLRSAS
jgi:tetratricopeptide (TPR) repeat protein